MLAGGEDGATAIPIDQISRLGENLGERTPQPKITAKIEKKAIERNDKNLQKKVQKNIKKIYKIVVSMNNILYLYITKANKMISIYKVSSTVDNALRVCVEMKREKDVLKKKMLNLHIFTMYSLMDSSETIAFLKIESKLSSLFDSANDLQYNTSQACCFFEVDKSDDIINVLMWSRSEYALLGFIKDIKNKFDKNNQFNVENIDGVWVWESEGYRFEFQNEYEAYLDILSYLKSLEQVADCLEK